MGSLTGGETCPSAQLASETPLIKGRFAMLRRLRICLGFLAISCLSTVSLGQADGLATVPRIPEAGAEFQVAHLRDAAELQLGQKPAGVVYKWTTTVKDNDGRKVNPAAAGLPVPLPNGPAIKVTRARSDSTYTFALHKTAGDIVEDFGPLVLSFGRDGTEATIEVVPAVAAPPIPSVTAPAPPTPAPPAVPPAPPVPAPPVVPAPPTADPPAVAKPATEVEAVKLEEKFDFSNKGLKTAKEDAAKFFASNKPESPTVLSPASYFLDKLKKNYQTSGGKFAMAGTKRKLLAANAVALTMFRFANEQSADSPPEKISGDWVATEQQLFAVLTKKDEFDDSVLTDNEKQVWQQFLKEWREDVIKNAPTRFKDALLQAAYEITKAGLEIQTEQEMRASTGQAAPTGGADNGANAGGQSTSAGAHPFHERRMNWIYHHHDVRMARAQRISGRR
jgi:hypothetical protein